GSASITVTAAQAATHLDVTAPATTTAGVPFSLSFPTRRSSDLTVTGYTGTVRFTTSDKGSGVVLPADYTFTVADAGVHTFTNGVTLVTAGGQTVTVTDTANGTLTGQVGVTVTPAAASTLILSAP